MQKTKHRKIQSQPYYINFLSNVAKYQWNAKPFFLTNLSALFCSRLYKYLVTEWIFRAITYIYKKIGLVKKLLINVSERSKDSFKQFVGISTDLKFICQLINYPGCYGFFLIVDFRLIFYVAGSFLNVTKLYFSS